ncbi:MAG: UDP-N-acetylglucosamine 2-epimerase (non-hydrolyzing) [Planctomycetota bacterium]
MVVLGTRPEAIKLCPVVQEFQSRAEIDPIVCSTGQHREMLEHVLSYFQIKPDLELAVMRPGQTLAGLTSRLLSSLDESIQSHRPTCLVVQGDTTTVMVASILGFYHKLPIVHVEAGLRTGDLMAPWPEEFNRRVAGLVATLHAAPTQKSADALLAEGTRPEKVRVTGNTVIDALLQTAERERKSEDRWREKYSMVSDQPLVLITGHRRESFGQGLQDTCDAIATFANAHPEVTMIYPVHLNPNVQGPVHELLGSLPNVHLLPPASYDEFVWLMDRASIVLTDSGGVQEEAPSLNCEVLVTREKTERPEAVEAGLAKLVGTDRDLILSSLEESLAKKKLEVNSRSITDLGQINNPYGDGKASKRIAEWMIESLV